MANYKKYSEYKETGIEWLPQIPKHWIKSKFGLVKKVLTDYTANGSFADLNKNVNYLYEEDYAVLVRLTDLRNNLKSPKIWVNEHSYNYLSKSSLSGGEFLLANVGANAGEFCQMPRIDKPATLAPNMFMATFDNIKVTEHFMSYIGQCKLVNQQLKLLATSSSAQPKLNKDNFKSILFTYPPTLRARRYCEVFR